MNAKNDAAVSSTDESTDRQIVTIRTFDARRQLVFDAWTKPEHVAKWFGPRHFTLPVCDIDLRPGGAYRFVMRGPDGADYPMKGVYREVVPPERLVYTDAFDIEGMPERESVVTILFTENAGRTTITMTAEYENTADRDAVLGMGMETGMAETLDRLAEHVSDTGDREMVITRVLNAPPELVWKAWTSPEHMPRWWGPRGFSTTVQEMDVRPGGITRFVMHGPDGTDYQNKIVYLEVAKPERLVYDYGDDTDTAPFRVTVTFDGQGQRTSLTMRTVFASAAVKKAVIEEVGAVDGAAQTLDRLSEQLAVLVSPETEFVISRVVDAPRDLVWKVHTEAEHLMHWWGPKGFTMKVANLDFRPGGLFHYHLQAPGGGEMWGRFVYREIVKPERIVYINSFSDPEGNITRAPFAESWPLEMLNTTTFEEQDGKTKITIRSVPWGGTEAERKTFLNGHKSMQGGYGGTFDQLAAYLERVAG